MHNGYQWKTTINDRTRVQGESERYARKHFFKNYQLQITNTQKQDKVHWSDTII